MLLVWIFHLFIHQALGDVDNFERVSLLINTPKTLKDQFSLGVTPVRPAFFGFPQYLRGSVNGILVYSVPENRNGCNPIDKSQSDKPWPNTPYIMIVDRGECTFVTKVKNAQAAGANACLVIDNIDEEKLPYMADDGTEDTVTIPSLFLRKVDGDKIKEAMDQSQVFVQINWAMPNPDDRVEWEMWHVPDDESSRSFKKAFKDVAESLGKRVMFTPHYVIVSGRDVGCLMEEDGTMPCGNACTNRGRYCYFDTNHVNNGGQSLSTNVDGISVVEESIRQLCLWQVVNQTENEIKWWDYVVQFDEICTNPDYEARSKCSGELMVKIFDHAIRDSTNRCVVASGDYGLRTDNENTLLEHEMYLLVHDKVKFIPTIRINHVPYRGSLGCPAPVQEARCGVLSTICAGFYDGTLPQDCGACGIKKRLDSCGHCEIPGTEAFNRSCAGCDGVPGSGKTWDKCGECEGPGPDICGNCFPLNDPRRQESGSCEPKVVQEVKPVNALNPLPVAAIVLGCAIFVAIAVYCYMRRRENAMRADLDTLLKQYLPLDTENPNMEEHEIVDSD